MKAFCATKKSHATVCGLFLIIILIVIDQLLKWFILHTESIDNLCNHGIAFGFILPQIVFNILWGSIMVSVMYFWFQKIKENSGFVSQVPLLLILGGGISNLIDRLYYGCVIDYIPFLNISSFNFADVCITVGAGIILWMSFKK